MAFSRGFSQPQPTASSNIIQLAVKGWALPPSKWAENPSAGLNAVVPWLEKKAGRKIHDFKDIGKTHVLLIDVEEQDVPRFTHLNGFTFSSANITVEESKQRQQNGNHAPAGPRSLDSRVSAAPSGPRSLQTRFDQPNSLNAPSGPRSNHRHPSHNVDSMNGVSNRSTSQSGSSEAQQLRTTLTSIIHRRYNVAEKFLDFSNLGTDPEVQASGLVSMAPGKVWRALFSICENEVFETPAKRRDMVVSVSLASNAISSAQDVMTLSVTFPAIHNLDLSNNNLSDPQNDLRFWRNHFKSLEHLIISGNPLDTNPKHKHTLSKWWRSLKLINGQPIDMAITSAGAANDIARTASPAPFGNTAQNGMPILDPSQSATLHPEFGPGSTFGLPQPGKDADTLQKEQLGLKLSFETRLKMTVVEQALVATNFDYQQAFEAAGKAFEEGRLGGDSFLEV